MNYTDQVFKIVCSETAEMDSIYEDFIIKLVGEYGLISLKKAGHLESCGVINGRQLYVLT